MSEDVPAEINIRQGLGKSGGWKRGALDVTKAEEIVKKLRGEVRKAKSESFVDDKTGLPNERALYRDLEIEQSRLDRGIADYAVAYLDIDSFKAFNKLVSHETADGAIRALARAFQRLGVLRGEDTAYRKHGDEFVALFRDVNPDFIEELDIRFHEKISDAFLEELRIEYQDTDVDFSILSLSIGVASPLNGEKPSSVLKRSDKLMQTHKDQRKKSR